MGVGRLLAAAAAGVAGLAAVLGASAAPIVRVSLTADDRGPAVGRAVALSAVARGFAHGDRVRIVAVRDGSPRTTTVATCAKALCKARFVDRIGETATFRALVLRHGKTIARSAPVAVTWRDTTPPPTPAPPPAPAPAVLAGHYCGLTNEGKSICFDVTPAPQVAMTNMKTESIATCGDGSSWLWTLSFSAPVSILQPGLTASYPFTGKLPDLADTTNIQVSYSLEATFDTAGNATGTIVLTHISWDAGGKHYDCAGDPRTWTARLGA